MNGQTTISLFPQRMNGNAVARRPPQPARKWTSPGQAAIEFALISVLALAVMLIGIQYALIGQAAVAVSQGSSALARWAASNTGNSLGTVNGSVSGSSLPTAAKDVLSQSILTNGGSDLTVTVTSVDGAGNTVSGARAGQSADCQPELCDYQQARGAESFSCNPSTLPGDYISSQCSRD